MKILSFGNIPKWAGGRQENGASNVIYNLALYMSKQPETEMLLAASDIFVQETKQDSLTILGWTKGLLLSYMIKHPLVCVRYLTLLVIFLFKYPHTFSFVGTFFKGIHLRRCIDAIKPQLVHLHGDAAALFMDLVPKSIKLAITFHGFAGTDKNISHYMSHGKMEKDICHSKNVSKLYFISHKLLSDFKDYCGYITPPTEVILNAYDDRFFYYIEPQLHDSLSFCTVASMSDLKGQERVLDGLLNCGEKCQYTCVGSVDHYIADRMKIKAKDSNVELFIAGTKSPLEIRTMLSRMDYMILPSSYEGFGLVYLESIACGIPVILPKNLPINGESDIIQPGINAVLLDDCSIESIKHVLKNINRFKFNHKTVSESIANMTWKSIANQYCLSMNRL